MSNQEKHDFVPCTCEDCFGRDDACCAYCHSRKSDPIHISAEAPTYVEAVPRTGHYSDPTRAMLDDPIWNAIWEEIKTWDVNVPSEYAGYCGATGNHATAIFLAIQPALQPTAPAEAQAVKPAPSAPNGLQVGKPISEERLKELAAWEPGGKNDVLSAQREEWKEMARELLALRTENASLLAAINRSNELDREAAEKIVALEKQGEQARADIGVLAAGFHDQLATAREEGRREGLEQAAKTVCEFCHKMGTPERAVSQSDPHFGMWFHGLTMCRAQTIRTLQNQTEQADSARKVQNG